MRNSRFTGYFVTLINHPLFSGSAVMVIGSNIINVGNYLYHLTMGRLLGPAGYGELASVLSVLGLLGMVPFSLGLVVTKFISSATTQARARTLVSWFEKTSFLFGFVVGVLVLVASPFIAHFLRLENILPITILAPIFFFSVVSLFNKSALQGLLRFGRFVTVQFVEVVMKLVVGIGLVFLGYSVAGALGGMVIGAGLALVLSHIFLKDYLIRTTNKPEIAPLAKFAVPVLAQSVAITSLYSTDLVLVKHFFSAYDAGLYAALSMLGRIIFFAAGPIGAVMFPMVASRKAKGQGYRKIFVYSLFLTLAISLMILALYWVVPTLAIKMLYGSLYLESVGLLVWFGLFMVFFTLSAFLVSFYLSLGKTRVVVLPVVAALLQVGGIWFIHNSLFNVILVSILSSAMLLVGLLIYLGYEATKEKGG